MIRLSHIKKYYRMGDEIVRAMDDVSLHVLPHEYVSIIGPSGSGKSTMMHLIGCLDTADSGTYMLDGLDVTLCTENELAEIRSLKIGFVFQQFYLLSQMTAYENVELPLIYQHVGHRERKRRVLEALGKVGLAERMFHLPNQMSGGQQQRVAIARALVTDPAIILADEPTGNLDSKSGDEVMEIFDDLSAKGNTILVITHSESVAKRAQRIVRVKDGRIYDGDQEVPV